jgi:hypothetical protein
MKDTIKTALVFIYFIVAAIVIIVDISSSYGEDNFLFWIFVRGCIAVIKGIFWPISIFM